MSSLASWSSQLLWPMCQSTSTTTTVTTTSTTTTSTTTSTVSWFRKTDVSMFFSWEIWESFGAKPNSQQNPGPSPPFFLQVNSWKGPYSKGWWSSPGVRPFFWGQLSQPSRCAQERIDYSIWSGHGAPKKMAATAKYGCCPSKWLKWPLNGGYYRTTY